MFLSNQQPLPFVDAGSPKPHHCEMCAHGRGVFDFFFGVFTTFWRGPHREVGVRGIVFHLQNVCESFQSQPLMSYPSPQDQ